MPQISVALDDVSDCLSTLPRTLLCDLLGCQLPLVLAGMGGVARSEFVAAVTQAGCFGFLGMVREPLALIDSEVRKVREHTKGRFGVTLIPASTAADLLRQLAQLWSCQMGSDSFAFSVAL